MNELKKPNYFWSIVGLIIGLSIFFISLSYNEKESVSGKITYNDEGLISFQSYKMDAFLGFLLALGCFVDLYYKIKKLNKSKP